MSLPRQAHSAESVGRPSRTEPPIRSSRGFLEISHLEPVKVLKLFWVDFQRLISIYSGGALY